MEASSEFHTVRGYQLLEKEKLNGNLTSAMEDYLEMICRRCPNEGYIRVNTLSELLNVAAPSVTKMVQNLSRRGLVDYKRYEFISPTPKGREIGGYLLRRHAVIETFLRYLGVEDEVLTETELIEHDISGATLQKIEYFNRFFEQSPEVLQSYLTFTQAQNDKT